ncbi:hypothetical protein [Providencia sp. NPDC089930]|uniref:hypothetical protein n=1 Tax=Providencia sp. NPDC089930 TaxID=3414704 RepID=UPI003C2D92D0
MNYQEAVRLIRNAEYAAAGEVQLHRSEGKFGAVVDTLFTSWGFIGLGIKVMLGRLLLGLVVASIAFAFMLIFGEGLSMPLAFASLMVGVTGMLFGSPSRAVLSGTSTETSRRVVAVLRASIDSEWKLNCFVDAVELVRKQMSERISRFSVFAGISWAALFWFWGAHVLSPNLTAEVTRRGLDLAVGATLVYTLFVVAATCHAAASRSIYMSIELALIELRSPPGIADADDASQSAGAHAGQR